MLERNKGLGKLSVYDNGEFDQSVSSSNLLNATVGAGYGMLSQNGVNLTSTLSTQSYIKFTYKVESGYEPEKWVVSAWAKAENAVASTNSGEAELGIKIVTHFSGTTDTVEKLIPFNPENEDWQYACSKVVELPSDAINSTLYGQITTIDIYLCYNYNYGSAYFDKVSINRSGNATEYEYNNLGKLQKITNSNNQEATLEYENTASEPSKITDITGNSYDVSYNESHSVTGTTYTDANGSEKVNTEYTYTDQGQLSSTKQTAVNLNKNIITSSSYFVDTSRSYYSKTHIVTDERGNETEYFYYDNGLLKGVIGEDGNGILYEYNSYGELIGAILATRNSSGEIEAVTLGGDVDYSYNSKHELDKVTTSSSEYSFVYDEWGKTIGIYVGDDALATYQYGENNGKLNRLTYGNGLYVEYVYDEIDRIIGICYNGTQEVAYEYASSGELSTITDIVNNTEYQYYYDGDGKLINERRIENGSSVTYNTFYEYDDYSRVTAIKRFFPSADTSVTSGVYYTYNSDGTISNIDQNIHSEAYTYDDFGRISNKSIIFGNNTLSSSYSYANVNENGTSSILSSVLTTIGSKSTQTSYTYDANGNITSILYGGKRVYYTYDAKGQLTREDNQALNETYVYTYDTAGNILARNTYAYTRSQTLGTAKSTKTYAYDSEWGDKLASINGTSFNYDAIGNPLKYYNAKNTYNFTWDNGRQLTSTAFNLGTVASYRYNQDGIRVGKTTEYIDYEYVLEGNKIIRQIETTIATGAIKDSCYYYDANGNIASAKINNNGTEYKLYFETNIQGDVLAVYNASGTCLMEITYDAYGNFTDTVTTSDSIPSMEQLIAVATPFRYRGYYYDNETSLYYLNSRYYDSANARFINADGYINANGDLQGFNMFAYCSNNPVMFVDPNGTSTMSDFYNWLGYCVDGFSTLSNTLNPLNKITLIGGVCVAAIQGRGGDIKDDWNNDCFNPFNQDEKKALESKVVSFYKGSTVVRQNLFGTCSIFGTIWAENGIDEAALNHEYGHSVQELILGPAYLNTIAAPSLIGYLYDKKVRLEDYEYYSFPWERTADMFGRAQRNFDYKDSSLAWAIAQNLLGTPVIPFYIALGFGE